MRLQLVSEALQKLDRFQLCQLTAKATRKLHIPGSRIEDTTNDVLWRLVHAAPNTYSKPAVRGPVVRKVRSRSPENGPQLRRGV